MLKRYRCPRTSAPITTGIVCNAGNQLENTEAEEANVEKQEAEEMVLGEQRRSRLIEEK